MTSQQLAENYPTTQTSEIRFEQDGDFVNLQKIQLITEPPPAVYFFSAL